jgi:hypothetical protein
MNRAVVMQSRANAKILRAVVRQWEQYGTCMGFDHMLACAITRQVLGRSFPMFGDKSDIQWTLIAMGLAAAVLHSQWGCTER